jgi:hypothetical protein
MWIQDIGFGLFAGAGTGIFVRNPVWAVKVLSGRGEDGEFGPAIWGLFSFLIFLGWCYSAIYEGTTTAIAAASAATAVWIWKINAYS